MENKAVLKRFSWLVAICFAVALVFSACQQSSEHPKADSSKKEQPKSEHPTNKPPATNQ
jgi:preprotein translocase subunit SecG